VLPLVMLAFGVYFWARRKELTKLPESDIKTNEVAYA
jgi:hypothetical protein